MSPLEKAPTKWRVVKIGFDLSEAMGGGSFTNTYAIPDDGRNIMDMTLDEIKAYPAVSAIAMLDELVANHRKPRP